MTMHKSLLGRGEKTLADYIERKEETYKPKLTFDQWLPKYLGCPFEDYESNLNENDLYRAWKAGQENV